VEFEQLVTGRYYVRGGGYSPALRGRENGKDVRKEKQAKRGTGETEMGRE
jgi:hypothetical protein